MKSLNQNFFARPAEWVAPELIGKIIIHDDVQLRITEVEAYIHPDDSANHCHKGLTTRNAPMWGPAGYAYIYLCYGIHMMFNIVTNCPGEGAAVLVRSAQPLAGLDTIVIRRRMKASHLKPTLLAGPGKVAQALGLDRTYNHHCLFDAQGLYLADDGFSGEVIIGPRVGIDYAKLKDKKAHLRFALKDSLWVSYRKLLI